MRRVIAAWFGSLMFFLGAFQAWAASPDVSAWLAEPILGPQQALSEVQAYTESRVPRMPTVNSVREWEPMAAQIRQDVLERVVYVGEAKKWKEQPTQIDWQETIDGGPGYHIRKLRYEAVPGLWIPAVLYEPDHLQGRVPVFMNVNGHEGEGKAVLNKQLRSINMAKRGMIVLNADWLGMGQLRGENFLHYRMNQLDLCGTAGLAVFYEKMRRGLDVLLAHEHADPTRVGVAGLSGGGWQTIMISSLDTRVTLANPVAGYSSFRTRVRFFSDLGDSEQTPVDLATCADYNHLTALLAPRPALLTYNHDDDCCFKSEHALPPLLEAGLPIYRLYGQEWRLRSHVNYTPGTHNFDQDNREALYRLLADHFFTGELDMPRTELPSENEVKTAEQLHVELPADNADFHSLALAISQGLPRNADLPTDKALAGAWQNRARQQLAEVLRARPEVARADEANRAEHEGIQVRRLRLKIGDAWTVPAVEITPQNPQGTTLVVCDEGRSTAGGSVEALLKASQRVVAIDPFYLGESSIPERGFLMALFLSAVGDRPLGVQARQIAAAARYLHQDLGPDPVAVLGIGARASLACLAAAALEPEAIGRVRLVKSLASLHEILEQNGTVDRTPELFCFGLLAQFDVEQLVALVAPRPVEFDEPSERHKTELQSLNDWYELLGSDFRVVP